MGNLHVHLYKILAVGNRGKTVLKEALGKCGYKNWTFNKANKLRDFSDIAYLHNSKRLLMACNIAIFLVFLIWFWQILCHWGAIMQICSLFYLNSIQIAPYNYTLPLAHSLQSSHCPFY